MWLLLATLPASAAAQTAPIADPGPTATVSAAAPIVVPGAASSPAAPSAAAPLSDVSPSSIDWKGPPDCSPPRDRLEELLRVESKHPLWGNVEVSRQAAGWIAHLHLSDGPSGAPSVSDRTLEGTTCAEVNEAALLVVSIMQREQQELDAKPAVETLPIAPAAEVTATQPAPAPLASPPLAAATPTKAATPRSPDQATEPAPPDGPALPTSTSVAIGAAWSLWNGQTPALGVIAEFEHLWGRFGIRPQLGWATSVNPIPTSQSVRVHFTTYDAGLRLCFNMVAGVNVCGGPIVQRITVTGDNIGAPTESSAWFPGASVALLGSQNHAGIGVWGAFGANLRFKEIALDVNPLGEVATVKRLTMYAWVGPQWRWR